MIGATARETREGQAGTEGPATAGKRRSYRHRPCPSARVEARFGDVDAGFSALSRCGVLSRSALRPSSAAPRRLTTTLRQDRALDILGCRPLAGFGQSRSTLMLPKCRPICGIDVTKAETQCAGLLGKCEPSGHRLGLPEPVTVFTVPYSCWRVFTRFIDFENLDVLKDAST